MLNDYEKSLEMAKKGQELVKDLLDINTTTTNMINIYEKINEV